MLHGGSPLKAVMSWHHEEQYMLLPPRSHMFKCSCSRPAAITPPADVSQLTKRLRMLRTRPHPTSGDALHRHVSLMQSFNVQFPTPSPNASYLSRGQCIPFRVGSIPLLGAKLPSIFRFASCISPSVGLSFFMSGVCGPWSGEWPTDIPTRT